MWTKYYNVKYGRSKHILQVNKNRLVLKQNLNSIYITHKYFKTSDPTQRVDVYEFFQFYNDYFFNGQLVRCVVRWTKRMTLCAGTCKNQGFGSSTISLSQALLKFRSPDQIKETLLHQMIHAYLFITDPQSCRHEGGHGQSFQAIMRQINQKTGLNITIYHTFKDEVNFYRQHIWRCTGRCRDKAPYFGYVRRSMNRKPQPADYWWAQHKRTCGGQYIKISQPQKSKSKSKQKQRQKQKKNNNLKKAKALKTINQDNQRSFKSWGCGKTITDYFKQMTQQSETKKKVQNKSQNKLQYFCGKGKTIDEYFRQMSEKK